MGMDLACIILKASVWNEQQGPNNTATRENWPWYGGGIHFGIPAWVRRQEMGRGVFT
jgi:hypothetical protein